MTESVPDEVLELVLYLTLVIPTNVFESWGSPSTFAGSPPSIVPGVLLVSKRWHYLGQPALFESAILRTNRQVSGLARNAGKVNERGIKQGTYLRRLRIEGGYNKRLNQLLAAAPGIETLFVGFDISLDDSASGLKRALQNINPSRLYLKSTPGGHLTAQNTMSLYAAVSGAFSSWTNLVGYVDTVKKRIDTSPMFMFGNGMGDRLRELSSLEYISMMSRTAFVIASPSLKTVQIRDGNNWIERCRRFPGFNYSHSYEKFVLGEGYNMVPFSDFPLFGAEVHKAITQIPDLPDKVWSRIFGYATQTRGTTHSEINEMFLEPDVNATRRHIVLVNKRFYRLGVPYLYANPQLPSARAAAGFVDSVQSSAILAELVREIPPSEQVSLSEPLQISASLTNLERVLCPHIHVFPRLAQCTQTAQMSVLKQADQSLPLSVPVAPRTFVNFPHLRHLTLQGGHGVGLNDVHPDVLSQLEHLSLVDPGPDMFRVFESMRLPRLREVAFSVGDADYAFEFLKTHGGKLDVLCLHGISNADATLPSALDFCSNITELQLPSMDAVDLDHIPFVSSSGPHLCLKRVLLPSFRISVPGRHDEEQRAWNAFISFLVAHKHKLSALEEIRLFTLHWPKHAWDYRVSWYAVLAFDLHELGIALADKDGTRWVRFDPIENWILRPARVTAPRGSY
ncbi:hypothetical protein BC628DRAFT_1489292 [Trametes gibbosa]|nr:hypothetical protein BC628DRAFT_1489292 [Trametes gibbosa]